MVAIASTEAIATVVQPTAAALELVRAVDSARAYAAAAKAENTRRAYRVGLAGLRCLVRRARAAGATRGPRGARRLRHRARRLGPQGGRASRGRSPRSRRRTRPRATPRPVRAASCKPSCKGIRRKLGVAQRQAAPVCVPELRAMTATLPDGLRGVRDRAMLLVGFAGAFRRSELVGLDVADLAFDAEGLTVTLRRSKTDQEGAGRKVGVPYGSDPATCPVRALRAWLEATGIEVGALFVGVNRHGRLTGKRLAGVDVARLVKRCAEAAGLDPARFSGHSLRAGLATAAAKAGKSRSARSWRRRGTGRSRWCGATSATRRSSRTTRRRGLGCEAA